MRILKGEEAEKLPIVGGGRLSRIAAMVMMLEVGDALEILKTMHRYSDFQDFNEKTLQKIKEIKFLLQQREELYQAFIGARKDFFYNKNLNKYNC